MNKNFQSRFTQQQNEIRKKSQQIQKTATVFIISMFIAVPILLSGIIFVIYKILNYFGIL